jgi:siroheme synthase-like protein
MTASPSAARRFDYPLSLSVDGLAALVVGGDHEAVDKARRLVDSGAAVTIVAPVPSEALRASGLPFLERAFVLDDARDCRLVVVSVDCRAHAPTLYAVRREWGFLLSSIDDPPHSDFASTALVKVGDVKIALSSGGRAPVILRRLREDLAAALVTPKMERFVGRMAAMRDEPPLATRIERVKAAIEGFGLTVAVRFPAWFEAEEKES